MAEPVQIPTSTVSGSAGGPHLLITGGVHGDEFESMQAIRRLIHTLDAATVRGRITLAPVVNASAFERRHRTGADELDLARTCPGSADGTITERTAHALSQLIGQADYYIDLHTGGTGMAVYPLAGYCLHSDPDVLDVQRRMARAFNLPLIWGTSAALDGRSLSVARDLGIPAIYTEYGGSAVCLPEGVDAYVEGCLNVMAALDMLDRPTPPSAVKTLVEDDRPGSGHMQVRNPASMAGYFDAAVQLGQTIRMGDPLGTVSDALGNRVETIPSDSSGMVIVLRTFPRVDKGDAVAVVIDTDPADESKA